MNMLWASHIKKSGGEKKYFSFDKFVSVNLVVKCQQSSNVNPLLNVKKIYKIDYNGLAV